VISRQGEQTCREMRASPNIPAAASRNCPGI
jgi:hypothetical protein